MDGMVGAHRPRRRAAWIAVAAMVLIVAACGQSRSDSAVDDAPLGKPTVAATVSVGKGPLLDVTVDPSTGAAYVTSSRDDLLSLIDADGGISAIEVGRAPAGVAVDPSTHTAYVTSLAEGAVSVVDVVICAHHCLAVLRPAHPSRRSALKHRAARLA